MTGLCVLGEEDPGAALDMIDKHHSASQPQQSSFPAEFALPETLVVEAAEERSAAPAQVSSMAAVALARLLKVGVDAKVVEVAAMMSRARLSLAVVCEQSGSIVGVIADTVLVHQLGLGQMSVFSARASDIMTAEFTACHPNDSLPQVLATMHHRGLIHIPIVDEENRPQGVVYARDGLRALVAAGNFEETQLRDYVAGVGYR